MIEWAHLTIPPCERKFVTSWKDFGEREAIIPAVRRLRASCDIEKQLKERNLKVIALACLVPIQKRLQVVETEGRANRYRLCRIPCPKLTVGVAANGSKDCTGDISAIDADHIRENLTLRVYQQVVLDFVDVSVRKGVSFVPSVLARNTNKKSIISPFIPSCAMLRRIACVLETILLRTTRF